MKIPLKQLQPHPANAANPIAPSDTEPLMPYGRAAKAIFVKANGLPAYFLSTGAFRYSR
jgi:hypothetical protein